MKDSEPVVVKVGGSLYDHREFVPGLRDYLDSLDKRRVLLVAGGGVFADAIRDLQMIHGFDDEVAHRHALGATVQTMEILNDLVGPLQITESPTWHHEKYLNLSRYVLLVSTFLLFFEGNFGKVPHTWELTTDSIAAYAAGVAGCQLILLKSIDVSPGISWQTAADEGWVDAHFPEVVERFNLQVEVINFRRILDARLDR